MTDKVTAESIIFITWAFYITILIFYQLKLVVAENKFDEFIDSLRFLSTGICKETGCLGFDLYKDLQSKNAYRVIGEWKTRQDMENHFNRENYSVLIGGARVLGQDFEMSIGETLEKGSYEFAQEKIALNPGNGKTLNDKRGGAQLTANNDKGGQP